MLFNIHSLEWDQELLELLNIPEIMLPEVKSNSEIYGNTTSYHFFGETIPIAGMCGDQQAALIGQLAFEKGMVKNTYGTGSFVIMNMGEEAPVSKNNLSTTIGYVIDGKVNYALEGSIFVTGSAIQWLRDGLEIIEKSDETEKMAYDSESDDEIYLVPAFTGLGAPHWESDARGAVYGITRGTDKKDIIKATLQSIAYLSRDVFDAMEKDTGVEITELRVDGGVSMNDYLMQFQADITDTAVRRPKNIETTVLGSAYLAGLAVGYWKDFDELKTLVGSGATFKPNMEDTKRKELYRGWENAVDTTIYYSRKDS
jgi:glycerol kinase